MFFNIPVSRAFVDRSLRRLTCVVMPQVVTYLAPGLIRVTDRAGAAAELRFTADGSLQQVTDPLGRTTGLVYDANGRAVEVIAADNSVTRFSYNVEGRLTS
jgi:YD repeat-containing protein